MMAATPDTSSVDAVLSTARSVRRKLDFKRPVGQQVMEDCINIATQAPVGLGGENWRFLIVRDEVKKLSVARVYREVMLELTAARGVEIKATHQSLMDKMHEMPVLIFVCAIGKPELNYARQLHPASSPATRTGRAPGACGWNSRSRWRWSSST